MAEPETLPSTLPPRRSALDAVWAPGVHGAPGAGGPGVAISRRLGLSVVQLDARRGRSDAVQAALRDGLGLALPEPGRAAASGDVRALWHGPDRWMLIARDGTGRHAARVRAIVEAVGGVVVDQGHGRAILRLEGPRVREVLAKGTGVDLHPRAFSEDAVAQTALFHLSATIDRRRGTGCFDVHVMRGFAQTFFESLCEAAGEFGYRVV